MTNDTAMFPGRDRPGRNSAWPDLRHGLLTTAILLLGVTVIEASPPDPGWIGANLPTDAEAWRLLPAAEMGTGQPLPVWARALARFLPRTTAAMLNLDWIHRTQSPLDPLLRGKMRWIAADANRCEYTRATAEADLRRAGLDDTGLRALKEDYSGLPDAERSALVFARKMTLAADTVTDGEVARIKAEFGDQKLTAMVLLLAYSNFQDRLLLTLGLPVEPGGPMAPVEVRFAPKATPPPVPLRAKPEERHGPSVPERIEDPEWTELDFDDLQRGLSSQRANRGRIRVPSWEEVKKGLPADYPIPKSPIRIRWSLVCMGYQPRMGAAWTACTRAFREEAKQDRVFEESLFWVVTRTIHCFY